MAYQTIKTTTRPNVDSPFFAFGDQITNYINETYGTTGKRISNTVTISEDKLKQIVTSIWINKAAFTEFMADPQVMMSGNAVTAYNTEHNLTITWSEV